MFADAHPEYQAWTASSMGQRATMAQALETAVYLVDLATFMRRLGMPEGCWEARPAMLPQTNVVVHGALASTFERELTKVHLVDKPLRYRRADGGFFAMDLGHANMHTRPTPVRYRGGRHPLAEFGMRAVEIEDRSGTTAYHVPEGILAVYDPHDAVMRPAARARISTLEIAPALLAGLGIAAPSYMVPQTIVSPG